MIDRILNRLGLLRRKRVIDGLLYIREWERAFNRPIGDRQMVNAITIASGNKPAPNPTEDKALLRYRRQQEVIAAQGRLAAGL